MQRIVKSAAFSFLLGDFVAPGGQVFAFFLLEVDFHVSQS